MRDLGARDAGHGQRLFQQVLVETSPLRRADPRTKLVLSLVASLAVMLPLHRLVAAVGAYVVLLIWARLWRYAALQVWRLKWLMAVLFVLDWWLVGPTLAVTIVLRLALLAGTFTLFFATTTISELRLALEWLRIPHRYAFSLALAFQSLGELDQQWRSVVEAQRARGAWSVGGSWRRPLERLQDLLALTVPAVVLTTKRAWAVTEAAYARGFESPRRRPYRQLAAGWFDVVLLAIALLSGLVIGWMRW